MDVLLLGSLYRKPMHGYQLKLELRYKHVDLWAQCDHGHLYYTLKRLEKEGWVTKKEEREGQGPPRKIFRITAEGRRHLQAALRQFGTSVEDTWFDIDLFLANSMPAAAKAGFSLSSLAPSAAGFRGHAREFRTDGFLLYSFLSRLVAVPSQSPSISTRFTIASATMSVSSTNSCAAFLFSS